MTSAARLITIEVILHDSFAASEEAIVMALQSQLVSWCVIEVDVARQTAIVDALIIAASTNLG